MQGGKPGLLGDAPIGLAPAGYEGGPEPLSGFLGGSGNGNKRTKQNNDFPPRKKSRYGLLGAAPPGFDILDDGYV